MQAKKIIIEMKKIVILLPVVAGILWGSAGFFVRELADFGMDGYTILSTRMTLAVLLMFFGIIVVKPSLLKIRWKDAWVFGGSGLLGILGLNYFYNEAVGEISLSLSAILLSMAPVFVTLLSSVLFSEKITPKKMACLFMALVGCTMASGVFEASAGGGLQITLRGIIMGLLSGFFCALYGIFSKIAANKGYGIVTILFYSLLLCSVVLLPLTNWDVATRFIQAAPVSHSVFSFFHSACTSILPYLFYSLALLYMENGKVSILAGGGEPMAAVVFGMVFFVEIPTALNLLGLAFVIVALTTLCLPRKDNPLLKLAFIPIKLIRKSLVGRN